MDKDFNKLLYEKTKQDYVLQLIRQISQPSFNKKNLSKTDLEYWDETCELIYQQKIFLEKELVRANQQYKELFIKKNPYYPGVIYYNTNPIGYSTITYNQNTWSPSWGSTATEI